MTRSLAGLLMGVAIAGPVFGADTQPAENPPEMRLITPDGTGGDAGERAFPGQLPRQMQMLQEQLQRMQVPGGPLDPEKMKQLQQQIMEDMQKQMNGAGMRMGNVVIGQGGNGPAIFQMEAMPETKLEKAAFLGVTTSAPSATLREQLQLPKGAGLVVDFVEADSPAAVAGLKQHDIVAKFEDQVLINAQQLAVLVRTKKGGDSVNLTVIREGKPQVIAAKLVEKEVPVLEDGNPWMVPNVKVFRPEGGVVAGGAGPQGNVRVAPGAGKNAGVTSFAATAVSQSDGVHDIVLKTETTAAGEKKTATVKDARSGKVLFDGEITTEEQRKALPEDIAAKISKLESKVETRVEGGE